MLVIVFSFKHKKLKQVKVNYHFNFSFKDKILKYDNQTCKCPLLNTVSSFIRHHKNSQQNLLLRH
jgi:hypothetical protein